MRIIICVLLNVHRAPFRLQKREKGTLRQKAQIIYVDQARKIVARNGRLKLREKRKKEIMAKVDIFSKF